jgi:hypothetical protein
VYKNLRQGVSLDAVSNIGGMGDLPVFFIRAVAPNIPEHSANYSAFYNLLNSRSLAMN